MAEKHNIQYTGTELDNHYKQNLMNGVRINNE